MSFLSDFHIHSHYSRACSRNLTPPYLEYWSKLKGLQVIGTGDCIHPGWLKELKQALVPADNGLYRLRPELKLAYPANTAWSLKPLYFMLTTEISSIYKRGGKVRKVHNICVLPDFAAADSLQAALEKIGNIASDGRPILGLDSRDLAEMVLSAATEAYLIPAHIWTPWFSMLGSKSGFDSLQECFGDMAPHIFAVETGLSSDPAMNRCCSFLDGVRLVSNSDAHSPEKLGREANVFDCELSYSGIHRALRDDEGFAGTIEFFPHEGKYHFDGHRKCGIQWDPLTTLRHQGICSECGKPVTRGVLYRVAELADRTDPEPHYGKQTYSSITPLPELLAEMRGVKSTSGKAVQNQFRDLVNALGSEFDILLNIELNRIEDSADSVLAEGIRRLRAGEVFLDAGYDGEFGKIRVFSEKELARLQGTSFFDSQKEVTSGAEPHHGVGFDIAAFQSHLPRETNPSSGRLEGSNQKLSPQARQEEAIQWNKGPCLVVAGPGTGKTSVLTRRIVHLIEKREIPSQNILALTFSNKAAGEMRQRVNAALGQAHHTSILTLHAFGLEVLRRNYQRFGRTKEWVLIGAEEKGAFLKHAKNRTERRRWLQAIEKHKQEVQPLPSDCEDAWRHYEEQLKNADAFDLEDLIRLPLNLWEESSGILHGYRQLYSWILVDEFQDISFQQYRLIQRLAGESGNLFCIGDPDQAIYGFRGADSKVFERLEGDFPELKVVRLDRSFRCPQTVITSARQVLGGNQDLSGVSGKVKIHLQSCSSEKEEADWIAEKIETLLGGVSHYSMNTGTTEGDADEQIQGWNDVAILCRTQRLFGPIAGALAQRGIAYRAVGQKPWYTDEDFRRCIAGLIDRRNEQSVAVKDLLPAMPEWKQVSNAVSEKALAYAGEFGCDIREFLNALALREPLEDCRYEVQAVSLMTMHASKGLEFSAVFLPALEEGLVPYEQFEHLDADGLAEEARLLYVGMTRAKRYLFLSQCQRRLLMGRVKDQKPSRYLSAIDASLLERQRRASRPKPVFDQMELFS